MRQHFILHNSHNFMDRYKIPTEWVAIITVRQLHGQD